MKNQAFYLELPATRFTCTTKTSNWYCMDSLSAPLIFPVGLQDGVLNDRELNEFQVQCFSAPLQPEELAGVKKVVAQKMPQVGQTTLRIQLKDSP